MTTTRFARGAAVLAALLLAPFLFVSRPAAAQSAPGFTVEREVATTADGVDLVLKRLKVPGGVPVLLLHGLGSNGCEFDLPSKSLASFLAGRGYDVWIANHRRVGKNGFRSGGRAGYDFDDLVALDMPALVEKVSSTTGERPFLVGHSMGGIMTLTYLEGAAYESVVVRKRLRLSLTGFHFDDVYGTRITGDAARAAARNSAIRGAVALASPPRLAWENEWASVFDFWLYNYWDYNILLRDLSWSPAANIAAAAFPDIPSARLGQILTDPLPQFPYLSRQLRPFLQAVAAQVGQSFLSAQVLYGPNMEGPVLVEAVQNAVDDTSGGVYLQLMDWIRERTLRDAHVYDPLRRPYVYADHYDRVSAPLLVFGGHYDKIVNDNVLERDGFGRYGSTDKTYLGVDYGHADLVIGRDAPRDVWAPIAAWLATR